MARKRSIEELQEVLDRVNYLDWKFVLEKRDRKTSFMGRERYDVILQVQFMAPDNDSGGEPVLQKGRKFQLSRYSCDTEIVQTAWAAVSRAILHETQEKFHYRGVSIWNNHVDVEALVEIAHRIDQRDPPE